MPLRVLVTCPHCGKDATLQTVADRIWQCPACGREVEFPSDQSMILVASHNGERVLRLKTLQAWT